MTEEGYGFPSILIEPPSLLQLESSLLPEKTIKAIVEIIVIAAIADIFVKFFFKSMTLFCIFR